jgi:hypothetical protein
VLWRRPTVCIGSLTVIQRRAAHGHERKFAKFPQSGRPGSAGRPVEEILVAIFQFLLEVVGQALVNVPFSVLHVSRLSDWTRWFHYLGVPR